MIETTILSAALSMISSNLSELTHFGVRREEARNVLSILLD